MDFNKEEVKQLLLRINKEREARMRFGLTKEDLKNIKKSRSQNNVIL